MIGDGAAAASTGDVDMSARGGVSPSAMDVPACRVVETQRMVLAPLTGSAVDDMVLVDSDPEVMRFIEGEADHQGGDDRGIRRSVGHLWLARDRVTAELVWAQPMTVNAASQRVMERCGLRFVRTFFDEWDEVIDGTEHGDVEYATDREEWERGRSSDGR